MKNIEKKGSDLGSRQPTVVYMHMNPDMHPRTLKIKSTLEKNGFRFIVLKPRFKVKLKSRLISSVINYSLFFMQSLFVKGDVIWVVNCPDTVGMGVWLTRKKYVYDYRSPWSKEIEVEFGKGVFSRLAGVIERRVRSGARIIVLVSSQMLNDVRELQKPVFVLPNYSTCSFLPSKGREAIRNEVHCGLDKQVILFVGKLSKVEGADMLERVADAFAPAGKYQLWIVGDGPLRPQIEALAAKYSEGVRYIGWVEYKNVPNYISASDVCIVPRHENPFSEYYNDQGIHKLAECIALGKPVVACNIASSPNYVLAREESFTDAIKSVLDGKFHIGEKKLWEKDCEPVLLQIVNAAMDSKSSTVIANAKLEGVT